MDEGRQGVHGEKSYIFFFVPPPELLASVDEVEPVDVEAVLAVVVRRRRERHLVSDHPRHGDEDHEARALFVTFGPVERCPIQIRVITGFILLSGPIKAWLQQRITAKAGPSILSIPFSFESTDK